MTMLTARQAQVLTFIRDHITREGFAPTVREIGDGCGMSSLSTVHAHLTRLQKLGLISRRAGSPRAMTVVDEVPV